MRDKAQRYARDDYESAVFDDMNAEAAYERKKAAWKKVPDQAPAPRPKVAEAYPVAVDDGTFEELKPALDGSNAKQRAAIKEELAAVPVDASKKETYVELHSNLTQWETAGKKDTAGNDLPANEAIAKKPASRAEMKKIRKRIAEKRKEGVECDTDDEFDAVGLLPPDEAQTKKGAPELEDEGATTYSGAVASAAVSLASKASTSVAALTGVTLSVGSPRESTEVSSPRGGAKGKKSMLSRSKGESTGSGKRSLSGKAKDCTVM